MVRNILLDYCFWLDPSGVFRYINIIIKAADSIDTIDILSPSLPISQRSLKIISTASNVRREMVSLSFCWSANTVMSLGRSP